MIQKYGLQYVVNHIAKPHPKKRRPGHALDWAMITIHATANPRSKAAGERAWLDNSSNVNDFVGWHLCVDDIQVIEAIPLNEVAWHAGDGLNGFGNRKTIGIEICESGDRRKTLDNAATLVAGLLYEKKKTVANIRQHHYWNKRTSCPAILRANNNTEWNRFLSLVEKKLNALNGTTKRVLVNGQQVIALSDDENLIKYVGDLIRDKKYPIQIIEIK